MMHPGKLHGQLRKKLRWLKVGLPILKTTGMVPRGSKLAFGVRFCSTQRAKQNSTVIEHSLKWQEIALLKFATQSSGGSKRHKSSGSSFSNTDSEDASINLNTNVGDNDEDEVQEIRRPEGRDKARAAGKKKGSKASGSSTMNEDALARLMVTEMTAQEKEERLAFLEIKKREVECHEREIEQQDMRFYLQPYDHLTGDQRNAMDEIKAKIKAKYNLQY
ncbi:hypothetical protein Tco_1261637 [Tanacetum coccineum]